MTYDESARAELIRQETLLLHSNFREVFIDVQRSVEVPDTDKPAMVRACATTEQDHPRLWRALEHVIAHKYERKTGHKITAGFDWQTIKQWIIDNWPQIMRTIISLIMMFI